MTLVIASQMGEGFDAQLRAHATAPVVIGVPEDQPWQVANDADILIVRPAPAWRTGRARAAPAGWPGRLRWVYSASAGVDFYPDWLLDAPVVSCGRGISAGEIADYVIAAIYLQAKDLDSIRAREPAAWQSRTLGRIAGSTIGIIGFGTIGTALARKAVALDMQVVATRRRAVPSPVEGVTMVDDPAAVFAAADHIVLAVPATPETRGVIDARLLARVRPGAHLINVSRGAVLDQAALIAALDDGRLGFATLDVTEPEPLPAGHPLWTHPKVRLTPHVSSNHMVLRHAQYARVADNLDRLARGEVPGDLVDRVAGY